MPIEIHMLKVRIRIVVEEDDGEGFHAYCPDLKGLHVDGCTEAEALEHAKEAAELYMWSLLKHEDPIPVGVLESHTQLSWSDVWSGIRQRLAPSRSARKHAYVEDITLNAIA